MGHISELKISKTQIEKLATNLRLILKELRLTENDVAQSLGIPPMTVRRLASGETTDPRISTLKLLADFFNVTVDSLIGDNGFNATELRNKSKPHFVPVLDWLTATKINTIKDIDLISWQRWQPVSLNSNSTISDLAFALECRPSMQPRFPHGTLFIIEKNLTPSDGDIVLLRIKETNELSLRELILDPPEKQLHPLTPGSSILTYSEQAYEIVGIVILTMFYNRKI